ncbi:MAG TPA: 16S rRNA methyltransferase [Candidatus Bathyarchaeia archaeon]|nr:16S rRNA methyltransferase [Candidatus Bathyarchaeia archaeon]
MVGSLTLTLVLAESSIELVPNEIVGHPSVRAHAVRKQKDPAELILDQSYHHAAILKLGHSAGRGRPDIAHFSLLTALGSPLNLDQKLRCFIHTRDDQAITVDPSARLPRNTDRFTSLLEQLYKEKVVPKMGTPLMSMKKQAIQGLLRQLSADLVVALTVNGSPKEMNAVADELSQAKNPVLLVGGFPVGDFSPSTLRLSSRQYRIDRRLLEAWTVVGRAIYDYEKCIGLRRF